MGNIGTAPYQVVGGEYRDNPLTGGIFQIVVANKYEDAIEYYTKAVTFDPTSAVLYGNRSFAHLKMESYGYALDDATKAIEIDPNYIKVGLTYGRATSCHGNSVFLSLHLGILSKGKC